MSGKSVKSVKIDGILYDISKFKHPGGSKMINSIIGSEFGTEIFQTYHRNSSLAHRTLLNLPKISESKNNNHGDQQTKQPLLPLNSTVYDEIQKKILHIDHSSTHSTTLLWFASNGILLLTGMQHFMSGNLLLGIIFLSFFKVHMGFTLYHYLHHGGLYKQYPDISRYLELFMNISTYHGKDWKHSHNLLHHVSVNDPDIDEDIFSGMPLIRLHTSQNHFWYHKYQHIYVWILYAFYGPFVILKGKKEMFYYPLLDITIYSLFPALINRQLTYSLISYLLIKILSGIIFITIFSLSHNSIDLITNTSNPTNPTNPKILKSNCWATNQITQSVNWGGKIACFLFGGINYQIEHHLFPNIHPMYYPEIAKIIQNYCKKNSIRYIHYNGFKEAFVATFQHIKFMGKSPQVA